MYRHLLVPVDDTDLSVEVVGNAVALARPLGARITFFHAVADAAGSLRGEAEVLRLTARDEYDYAIVGKARELLAKAEAAARALGVPCESRHAVSDRPAQAIVEAARAERLRPDLHGLARPPRQAGHGLRVRDAGGADECRPAGAGVVHRRARGAGAGHRHHPRRTPLAGGGDARLDACAGRGARAQAPAPTRR